MAQLSITQLPIAGAITGTEPVPVVQNGVTVQTTTGAISGAGALNYPFLTVGSTTGLTQARYIATNAGLSLTDNGAGGTLQVNLIGAALSLNSSGNGIQVKTGLNTVTNVSLAAGTGLSATNADGTTGNPTISLGAALQQFVSLTGTGMLAIQNGLAAKVNILGTTSQTSILNGNGAGDVTVGIADNPIFPGTGSATLPNGTTAQRSGSSGAVRYNTSLSQFEGYTNTGWNQFSLSGGVTSFSAGTTGFSPNTATTGAVTLSGTLNVANGGTGGTATPTAGTMAYGNGTAYAFTAAGTSGQVLTSAGAGTPTWTTPTTGTVTAVSVATANGLAGTSSGGATPALTLSTTITGVLKGNGTAISAATSGTDYAPATSGTSILYGNGSGGFSNVTIGTGVAFADGTLSATGSGGTVTSVTGTAPVVSSGGNTPAISMAAATTSVNGYLTSTDWTTFNSKQAALVSGTNIKTVNGTTLLGSGDLGTITYAYGGTGQTTVTTGDLLYGSASNVWSKLGIGTTGQILRVVSGAPAWGTDYTGTVTSVAALTLGTTGTDLSSTVATSTTTPVITLNVPTASAANRGALSAADWTTFNNKGSGSVTSVSFTGGIISVATATTTPALTVAGTSGGIPYFSSASTWATSAALTANAIVLGGGAGASPSVLASLGTTSTVLHGNAAGAPTFGAVSLTADVSGTLPIANGGTNSTATATAGGAGYGTGTAHAYTAAGTAGQVLTSAGASAPTWSGIAGGTF